MLWEFFFILWVGGTLRGGFNFVWGYRGDAYCKASLIVVPVGAVAPFWSGDNPFRGLRGAGGRGGLVDSVQNRGHGVCAPQLLRFILLVWHFTCGFDFRHKSKIAICGLPFMAAFAVLGAVSCSSCGKHGFFFA